MAALSQVGPGDPNPQLQELAPDHMEGPGSRDPSHVLPDDTPRILGNL